jgi:hypothetical protein
MWTLCKEFTGDFYNEDYFLRGPASGKGWLQNYRFLPKRTIKEALGFIDYFGLDEDSYVLEFGCAFGFLVKCLRFLEIKSDGCDISDYALSFAPEGCWNSTNEKTWDEHANFGYTHIIIKDALEHLNKEQLFRMLNNFSKVAHKLMCVVPIGDGTKYYIPEYHTEISHLIIESVDWWKNAFEKSGWKLVKDCPRVSGIKDNWAYCEEGNHVFVLEYDESHT